MIKSTLLFSAAALVLAGPALANTTKHHHTGHAAHAHASAKHSDQSVIDRCIEKRYAEKVACLRQTRGGYTDQWNALGASSGASAGGMTGAGMQTGLRTPAQPNETQPGQSRTSNNAARPM